MRIIATLVVILSLAACNRGSKNADAVRQGIIDHLSTKAALNVAGLDVAMGSVEFDGGKAKATVTIRPKGGSAEQAMSMSYELEQQNNKWVVVGRQEPGGMPHGGGAAPPAGASPHGAEGGAPGGKMPSPEDLPPAGKK